MNTPNPAAAANSLVVKRSLMLPIEPARAFELFTSDLDSWWPRSHHIGVDSCFRACMEGQEGGRWYERAESGGEADWGRVLAWQPPRRLLLSWSVNADWQADASIKTEVELHFSAAERPDGGTLLELEHRGFEQYLDKAGMMHAMFDSPGGWSGILAALPGALLHPTASSGS